MNGKKARKLRKSLNMTKANHRVKEYHTIVHDPKVVYFRNKRTGELDMVKTQRGTLINTNLYTYRKMKKDITNGRK